jgi:hypothetical protein
VSIVFLVLSILLNFTMINMYPWSFFFQEDIWPTVQCSNTEPLTHRDG